MGSHNFFPHQGGVSTVKPTAGLNMQNRAIGSTGFGARGAGNAAQKTLGVASALNKGSGMAALKKTAASNAPGPKKV